MPVQIADTKIAGLIDAFEVSIVGGEDLGLRVGDSVALFNSFEILDPDTAVQLGEYRRAYLTLRVKEVFKKYAIARVSDTYTQNGARRLKQVAEEARPGVVSVKPGMVVTVTRPTGDEEPF